jgi:hypothetical protein
MWIKLYVWHRSKNPVLIYSDVSNVKPSRKIRRSAFLLCNLGATTCVLYYISLRLRENDCIIWTATIICVSVYEFYLPWQPVNFCCYDMRPLLVTFVHCCLPNCLPALNLLRLCQGRRPSVLGLTATDYTECTLYKCRYDVLHVCLSTLEPRWFSHCSVPATGWTSRGIVVRLPAGLWFLYVPKSVETDWEHTQSLICWVPPTVAPGWSCWVVRYWPLTPI